MRISDLSSDVCSSDLDREVDDDLLELALVGLDHAEVAAMAHLQLDVLADEAAQQVRQLGQDVGQVQQARLQGLLARKGKKRSEEHTSELQSLMRTSYAVFCLVILTVQIGTAHV